MKRHLGIISLLFVFCIFLPKANAQFSIGLKVSGNYSNYMKITEPSMGWDAGLFMRFGDRFYFQPEVGYSFRSTNFNDLTSEVRQNIKLKQHFIDVPLLLGYHFIDKDNFKLHLFIGPRLGIRMGSNIDEIETLEVTNQKMQWGGQVGLGVDIWRFTLDARYDISGSKFLQAGQSAETWKQSMFVLTLGFKIVK